MISSGCKVDFSDIVNILFEAARERSFWGFRAGGRMYSNKDGRSNNTLKKNPEMMIF
jgi:hypothetical protein